MKTQWIQYLASFFVVALLAPYTPAGAQQSDSQALETRRENLSRLRKEVSKITEQIKSQRAKQTGLQKEVQEHDRALAKTASEKFRLQQEARKLEERQQQLAEKERKLDKQIEEQREAITAQVVAAYHLQAHNQVAQWLSQKNPAQARRNIEALGIISEHTDKQLKAFETNLNELQSVKVELLENSEQIARNLRSVREKEVELATQRETRIELLAALQSDLASQEAHRKAKQSDEAELEKLINSLELNAEIEAQRQQAATQSFQKGKSSQFKGKFSQAKGKLYWPAEGKHISRFGSTKPGSDTRARGVTIAAEEGSPVYAVFSGIVIFADYLPAQGMLIIVDHGDDYWSLYSHNESLLHSVGDYVEESQPIATVGASGGLKDPGLYFEIRRRGQPTNPSQWCQKS